MGVDLGQIVALGANVGVIAGLVFLALEVRQNNKFLAAQARYSLRQYRSDIADSLMLPHVIDATHKWARGEAITPEERSTGLMVAIKIVELWEWQYVEPLALGAFGSTIRVHFQCQFERFMTCANLC